MYYRFIIPIILGILLSKKCSYIVFIAATEPQWSVVYRVYRYIFKLIGQSLLYAPATYTIH